MWNTEVGSIPYKEEFETFDLQSRLDEQKIHREYE